MKVKQLINELKQLPQDKEIHCHVLEEDGPHIWSMFYELRHKENLPFVQLAVFHPELKELPDVTEANKDPF